MAIAEKNYQKELKTGLLEGGKADEGELPPPTKNWGAKRDDYYWTKTILKFSLGGQVVGELVLLLFLFSFVLGGTDWEPFGWAVALTVFDGCSFLFFGGLWLYITFMNPEFFWLQYGISELTDTYTLKENINGTDDVAKAYHKLEKRRTERKRSFNMFMVVLIVALVIKFPIVWTWLVNNSAWIPKTVGGSTPNTPAPSYIHYWKFYLNSGIELFACLTVIVAAVVLFFRILDDNAYFDVDGDKVHIFGPKDMYTICGWIMYVLLMVYHFLWVLVIGGSTEVPIVLMLVLISINSFLTLVMWVRFAFFPPEDSKNMRNDIRYRCVASIIYLVIFNIWQIIFFAYYYSAATPKEKGDGHFPRFQPSRAAVGQYNFYYYAQLTVVINVASWVWSASYFCEHAWLTSHHNGAELQVKKESSETKNKPLAEFQKMVVNQRHIAVHVLVYIFMLYGTILFGFSMNELAGSSSYLASRFWTWTITTTILWGVIWAIYFVIACVLMAKEHGVVHHWYTEPVLVSFIMLTIFVIVYIWLFAFYQNNYNDLGKASSNAAVNDPANHLSVLIPQLFGIYVLGTIAFLYFLVDFVSHPVYLIKVSETEGKNVDV